MSVTLGRLENAISVISCATFSKRSSKLCSAVCLESRACLTSGFMGPCGFEQAFARLYQKTLIAQAPHRWSHREGNTEDDLKICLTCIVVLPEPSCLLAQEVLMLTLTLLFLHSHTLRSEIKVREVSTCSSVTRLCLDGSAHLQQMYLSCANRREGES